MRQNLKLSTYTITIVNQGEEFVIFPDRTTEWDLQSGDTIEFANMTDSEVTVILNPAEWLQLTGNPIGAGTSATGIVENIAEYNAPLEFLFAISAGGGVFMVSGGPKMVPTNPDS